MTSHQDASNANSPSSPASASKSSFLPGVRSSPRSSVDSGSPFLQNLQQRFRKASNASHTSSGNGDGGGVGGLKVTSPTVSSTEATAATGAAGTGAQQGQQETNTTKSRSEASRRAKRYILEVVKDDWEYPQPEDTNRELMRREVVCWRRREDGLSDLESEKEAARRRSQMRPAMAAYQRPGTQQTDAKHGDPYKFDNPDAVGDLIEEKRRKRRKLEEEECGWNEGLRIWVQQRDAWTGANEKKPERRPASRRAKLASLSERNESGGTEDSQPLSAASHETGEEMSASSVESVDEAGTGGIEEGPWLPIYPPLFDEDNILRSRIQPTAYPTIYSKVVLQSLTPNIPIPLTQMTKVLVEGWKSEGNWPPGATQLAAKEVKTGKKSNAFLRWRNAKGDDKEGKRERVRKSIGFVKKAVGLEKEEKELKDVGIEFDEETAEEDREAGRIY